MPSNFILTGYQTFAEVCGHKNEEKSTIKAPLLSKSQTRPFQTLTVPKLNFELFQGIKINSTVRKQRQELSGDTHLSPTSTQGRLNLLGEEHKGGLKASIGS